MCLHLCAAFFAVARPCGMGSVSIVDALYGVHSSDSGIQQHSFDYKPARFAFLSVCGGERHTASDVSAAECCMQQVPPVRRLGLYAVSHEWFGLFCGCRLKRRVGYRGVRVGEASHPGPASGAATATANKRIERELAQLGEGNLAQLLTLLLRLLLQLAGGGSLVNAVKSMAGNGLSSVLASLLGSNSTSSEGTRPRKRKKKRRVKAASRAVAGNVTSSVAPAVPAEGPSAQPGGPEPAKGKGAAGISQPKGKGMGKSKGNTKGKGSNGAMRDKAAASSETQPLANACLRPTDWHGTVLLYESLTEQLPKAQSGPLVVHCKDAVQADAAAMMLQGSATKFSATFLWLDREGTVMVPFVVGGPGGRVVPLHVSCREQVTKGIALPSLKAAPKAARVVPKEPETCQLRVVLAPLFLSLADWNEVSVNPRRFLQARFGEVKDAWGFAREKRGGKDAIVGLVRVQTALRKQVLGKSGRAGVFIEPVGGMPEPVVIEWSDPKSEEKPLEHLDRLLQGKPSLGVVCGDRQLGVRKEGSKDGPVERSWRLDKTPLEWTEDFVASLIMEQSQLSGVRVKHRNVRGNVCSWDLRATAPRDVDCVQLATSSEDSLQHVYWVLPARPARGATGSRQPLSVAGPFRFAKDAFKVTSKAQAPASVPVPGLDGKDVPAAKRQAQEIKVRQVPDGVEAVSVPGNGNCFYICLSEATAFIRQGKARDPALLRAEIVAYQRKHAATFQAWWDGTDSKGQSLSTFEDYLCHMQTDAMWAGPLEIEAAARMFNLEVFVVPADGSLPPVVHNQGGPYRVALWFTGSHFDWLRPKVKDHGFPAAITNICAAPDMCGARGGGPSAMGGRKDDSSVAGSAWTVWTRDSKGNAVPVPSI